MRLRRKDRTGADAPEGSVSAGSAEPRAGSRTGRAPWSADEIEALRAAMGDAVPSSGGADADVRISPGRPKVQVRPDP